MCNEQMADTRLTESRVGIIDWGGFGYWCEPSGMDWFVLLGKTHALRLGLDYGVNLGEGLTGQIVGA